MVLFLLFYFICLVISYTLLLALLIFVFVLIDSAMYYSLIAILILICKMQRRDRKHTGNSQNITESQTWIGLYVLDNDSLSWLDTLANASQTERQWMCLHGHEYPGYDRVFRL